MIDKLDFLLALAREEHFGRAAESLRRHPADPVRRASSSSRRPSASCWSIAARASRASRRRASACSTGRGGSSAIPARCGRRSTRIRHGLTGRLRIAAIPTALAMVASLTTPFRMRHPNVQFTILSRTSIETLAELENLEIDAGITYLDNEPLGKVNTVPLYRERYRLLTSADAPLGDRDKVTWAEVARGAALPAHPRHAEPAHHRRPAAQRRLRAADHAGIEFHDHAVRACADRALGERDAGEARRNARPHRP